MKLHIERGSTIPIEKRIQMLALEGRYIKNPLPMFKEMMFDIITKIKHIVDLPALTFTSEEPNLKYRELFKEVYSNSKDVGYTQIRDVLVDVPEGFSGKYLEYVMVLSELSPDIHIEARKLLEDYSLILSSFINNQSERLTNNNHKHFFDKVEQKRVKSLDAINKFFKPKPVSKASLGSVLDRMPDLIAIESATKKLVANQPLSSYLEIKSLVDHSVSLLDILLEQLDDKELEVVSPNSALNISSGAYTIARYVEFIGLYKYRVDQYHSAMAKTLQKIKDVL